MAATTGVSLLVSSSSHNFLDVEMARRAGVQLQLCPNLSVTVANGDRVASPGKAPAQQVNIGGEAFNIDLYALPLDDYDMVLGVQWLGTLGLILWDFARHTLCFHMVGEVHHVEGCHHHTWPGVCVPHESRR